MRFLYLFLLLSLFSLISFDSHASHLVGADMQTFSTSSAGVYKVRLTIYRDCQGIPLCTGTCQSATCSDQVGILDCNGNNYGNVTIDFKSVSDCRADLCPSAKTICDNLGCETPGTLSPGIEKYVFEGSVDLSSIPSSCEYVTLYWTSCCRNGAISTGSAGQGFYIDAVINKNVQNSNPVYLNDPFIIAGAGHPYVYNMGAFDQDGDSLSFAFASSLQAANTPVDYIPPYSAQTPMPWTGLSTDTFPKGISCNKRTGDLMFTPISGGSGTFVGIFAIEVTEWRKLNGTMKMVGHTRRDIQCWVIAYPAGNSFPTFHVVSDSTPVTNYIWKMCEGETVCFDITAKDSNTSDSTFITFDNSMTNMGATITPKYGSRQREDAYTFCWTAPAGSARDGAYNLFALIRDNYCPLPGKLLRSFSIYVGKLDSVSIHKNITCNQATLSYNSPSSAISKAEWLLSMTPGVYDSTNLSVTSYPNPTVTFHNPGWYYFKLRASSGNCTKVYSDSLLIQYSSPSAPVINGDSIVLQNSVQTYTVPFHTGSGWQWFITGDSSHSALDSSVTVYWGNNDSGRVAVIETNSLGCVSDTGYLFIRLSPINGIQDLNELNTIQWYPVPAKDALYFSSGHAKIKHIQLCNLEGKALIDFSEGDILKRELPLKNIPTGIYLIKLEGNGNSLTKKISIVK